MKFDFDDKNKCRLVCVEFHLNQCRFVVAVAKCLGGSLFWDTVYLISYHKQLFLEVPYLTITTNLYLLHILSLPSCFRGNRLFLKSAITKIENLYSPKVHGR